MVDDDTICSTISGAGADMEKAARELVEKANAGGGEDNITAVLIHVR
jgi:protein phosphatase